MPRFGQGNNDIGIPRRQGWSELFVYGINTTLAAGTGTVYTSSNLRVDSDADFSWQKTCFNATSGNIRVKYRDESMGRYLIKGSSDLRNIGSNFVGTPFIWGKPFDVLAGVNFTLEAADNSGVPNVLRFAMVGGKKRPGLAPWDQRYRATIPFVLSTEPQSIPASSSVTLRLEVDNDAHFLIQKITGRRLDNCLLEFKESARDREWQNTAIHFDCFVGNGQFPHVLHSPRFIPRGSVLTINVTEISTRINTVEINLIGVKMYE